MDSNHRRQSQQIYSLPHLATLVTTRALFSKASAKVRVLFQLCEQNQHFNSYLTLWPFLCVFICSLLLIRVDIYFLDYFFLHGFERLLRRQPLMLRRGGPC